MLIAHIQYIQHMGKVGYVAAAPGALATAIGPLACPSRSARPRKAKGPNPTLNMNANLLKMKKNGHVQN